VRSLECFLLGPMGVISPVFHAGNAFPPFPSIFDLFHLSPLFFDVRWCMNFFFFSACFLSPEYPRTLSSFSPGTPFAGLLPPIFLSRRRPSFFSLKRQSVALSIVGFLVIFPPDGTFFYRKVRSILFLFFDGSFFLGGPPPLPLPFFSTQAGKVFPPTKPPFFWRTEGVFLFHPWIAVFFPLVFGFPIHNLFLFFPRNPLFPPPVQSRS